MVSEINILLYLFYFPLAVVGVNSLLAYASLVSHNIRIQKLREIISRKLLKSLYNNITFNPDISDDDLTVSHKIIILLVIFYDCNFKTKSDKLPGYFFSKLWEVFFCDLNFKTKSDKLPGYFFSKLRYMT